MTTPATPPDHNAVSQKLVQELHAMRDALVTLSLCLKEWPFELDQQGRHAALRQAAAVLDPMRLKPHAQENHDAHQKPQ